MAFDSFGAYLKKLEAAGELKRITQPVATELEITALADREMKQPEWVLRETVIALHEEPPRYGRKTGGAKP